MQRCYCPRYALFFFSILQDGNISAIIHLQYWILCSKAIPQVFPPPLITYSLHFHKKSPLISTNFTVYMTILSLSCKMIQLKPPNMYIFIISHIAERRGTQTSALSVRAANLVRNPLKRTEVAHGWMPQQKHLNHTCAE